MENDNAVPEDHVVERLSQCYKNFTAVNYESTIGTAYGTVKQAQIDTALYLCSFVYFLTIVTLVALTSKHY